MTDPNRSLFQPASVRRLLVIGLLLIPPVGFFIFSLPRPLFTDPVSTVLFDRHGSLLGAKIAVDHQWRFPENRDVPEKFRLAAMHYEDRYFPYHPGTNPAALARAAWLYAKHGKIMSGGSTITMQVVRMIRKNRPRTLREKLLEILLSLRLEFTSSKAAILGLYASHAPFGGNVVGLDAASWRYFGCDPGSLSWAQAATLAVLPNSPGLIYPGRNLAGLLARRNHLLDLLYKHRVIDSATWVLARDEKLPGKPLPLPQWVPHLLDRVVSDKSPGARVKTTLDLDLQRRVTGILDLHKARFEADQVRNAAAILIEVNTGNVLAYAGNTNPGTERKFGNSVDIVMAPRSTGSILKPFLFAAMLSDGLLLPGTLVPDIPVQIGGFIPENYSRTYDGAVPARMALSRSLNIPAVKMLQVYGYEHFDALLKNIGMTTLNRPPDHYGLSVILGGAEATLWDLAGMYASMARTLNTYNRSGNTYCKADFHPPRYLASENPDRSSSRDQNSWFDAGSIWLTFDAMVEVARPDMESHWQQFSSRERIAWKTGTSFGNRDAWSVGITPEYVVAVWVGNASGEGRPALTGIGMAAPVLFDIFNVLPPASWFGRPDSALLPAVVCRLSGHLASPLCQEKDTVLIPRTGLKTQPCPYHQLIHLDLTGTWQVNSGCESPGRMQHVAWFVLPPAEEWYYRNRNPQYKPLPPFRADCAGTSDRKNMDLIYPKHGSRLFLPVDLDGNPGKVVFKAAHRMAGALVTWHLDGQFIGTTRGLHQLALAPAEGRHRLTLVDDLGESFTVSFEILSH